VESLLNRRANEKIAKHRVAAAAAGCGFVPLVFASLGSMHKETSKFLSLTGMRLEEKLLESRFGGHRRFIANMMDGLSCALVRGNARVLFAAAVELEKLAPRAAGRFAAPG
jgi:hypothetical protein